MKTQSTESENAGTIAVIERYTDAPDECTILSTIEPKSGLAHTEWISAKEGSYLSLQFAR